jgi:anti-sigma B factor antagonist
MPSTHRTHWLEREDFGDVTVVRFQVPQVPDEDIVRAVFDPISSLVADVGRRHLVLNLATVEYLPSLALGKLVMLNRKAQAAEGRLALCHLSPTVAQILDSTSLTELLHVYGDEREAVRSFT